MIIGNRIVSKIASYQTAPNLHSYLDEFFEFENPELLPLFWEASVTNGLGYKKVGCHEDSEKGLTRHLGVMESAVEKNHSRIKERMRSELDYQKGMMCYAGMKQIEYAVDSLKKRIELNGKEDREMISRMMSQMVSETKQAIDKHYHVGTETAEDAAGAKPEKQSLFKQILSWIQ